MSLARLQRLADSFAAVPPSEFEELADLCRELAINRLDVRYMVLGECLRLSAGFWRDGEGAAVTVDFSGALAHVWDAYASAILEPATEEEGTAIALALLEELKVLGGNDPLTYRAPPG